MRRRYGCLIVFALASLFFGVKSAQEASGLKREKKIVPLQTIIEALDEIDKTRSLSPARASQILGSQLDLLSDESNKDLKIFRGQGAAWKEAELRMAPSGDGTAFVLVLKPTSQVKMQDLTAHFGQDFKLESPNPNAGSRATYGYTYIRKFGRIRFSFPSFQDFYLTVILIDRMP